MEHIGSLATLFLQLGNGTAEATIKDANIFRIDLHRFNRREGFYPYTGPANDIGVGNARGLNLNVTWSQGGMRNTEYAAAFYELILPLLVNFKPDLLIISCGLDAAMGDLLGGCELVSIFRMTGRWWYVCRFVDSPFDLALFFQLYARLPGSSTP